MIARHIGGTGRVGSALLGSCLAMHPDVVYFREPRFICDAGGLYDYLTGEVTLVQFEERMINHFRHNLTTKLKMMWEDSFIDEVYSKDEIVSIFNDPPWESDDRFVGGHAFIERLFGAMMITRRYWIEKTPHTVRRVDLLYKMFGEGLRYVHLIREPKDIAASLLHQKWGPKKPETFVHWYKEILRDAQRSMLQVPAECYLVVGMETLVQHPHATLERVLRFFEIEYDVDWLHQAASGITQKQAHIGRYERDLSFRARVMIDQDCGDVYRWWRERGVRL